MLGEVGSVRVQFEELGAYRLHCFLLLAFLSKGFPAGAPSKPASPKALTLNPMCCCLHGCGEAGGVHGSSRFQTNSGKSDRSNDERARGRGRKLVYTSLSAVDAMPRPSGVRHRLKQFREYFFQPLGLATLRMSRVSWLRVGWIG